MEVFAREYFGKLALSVELLRNNFEVIIGHNHSVRTLALDSRKGSVYYEIKGESNANMPHLTELNRKGICIVGQDEEAGINYLNFEDFMKFRPEVNNIKKFENFFMWGEDDLIHYKITSQKSKLFITGSPRSIFWGEFGSKFFKSRKFEDERISGNYLLLITNLGVKNPLGNLKDSKRYSELSGYPDSYQKYMKERGDWETHAYKSVVRIVKTILAFTSYRIVLRPHPAENMSNWEREFQGEPRVLISKLGNSIPVILGAAHVLHSGSTTGLESLLCNKSTISYNKIIGNDLFEMVSDRFSISPESVSQLVELLNSGEQYLAKHGFEDLIKRKITMRSNIEVLKIQASAISKTQSNFDLNDSSQIEDSNQNKKSISRRLIQRIRYGKNQYEVINKNKRPRISIPTISDDLKRLSTQLDFSSKVDVIELGESTFSLKVR
jgi:surface carbohydrate biosynthesis protein